MKASPRGLSPALSQGNEGLSPSLSQGEGALSMFLNIHDVTLNVVFFVITFAHPAHPAHYAYRPFLPSLPSPYPQCKITAINLNRQKTPFKKV
ncbi:MAG: hypothetical protein II390_02850 [Prevotella sp.]|nr:hypothetical protein [Prevotella sp.]